MSAPHEAMERVIAELDRRIARLEASCRSEKAGRIADEVDAIRCAARDLGLFGIAELARGLCVAMAGREGGISVLPWLDAMRGLLGHDPANIPAAQNWAMSLSQRYHA